MKKVRVYFWIEDNQNERLANLSRKTRVLLSDYVQEAINDLLDRHEEKDTSVNQEIEEGTGAMNEASLKRLRQLEGG